MKESEGQIVLKKTKLILIILFIQYLGLADFSSYIYVHI